MRFDQELLFISDIHLGSNLTHPLNFRQFLAHFIKNDNYQLVKKIVILGDFLELMLNDLSVIMKDNDIRQIFNLLGEISNTGVELHYILGNHDITFIGDFENEKESFQNELAAYNCNFFHSISKFAIFSFNKRFTPFDNFEEITKMVLEPFREPHYLFLHGHQFDNPLVKPTEHRIWAKRIKDDQIWLKKLCDYLKNYCWNCYLRNQGNFWSAWEEFKEFYKYKVDKSDLSGEEVYEMWKFKTYLYFWILGKKLKKYPLILNSYKDNIFYRARDFLKSNNMLKNFTHIIFGHTHIPGFYEPLFSNGNSPNFPVLVNTGTWQQGEYEPYIIRLSATNGINFFSIGDV